MKIEYLISAKCTGIVGEPDEETIARNMPPLPPVDIYEMAAMLQLAARLLTAARDGLTVDPLDAGMVDHLIEDATQVAAFYSAAEAKAALFDREHPELLNNNEPKPLVTIQ